MMPRMSNVTLVGPEIEENLALRYLASSLSAAGHNTDIVAFNEPGDFGAVRAHLLATQPAVTAISLAFQWRAKDFLALAVALREGGYSGHITAGGHFGTFAATEILADFPEIDTIVRQEAEETLVRLVDALAAAEDLRAIPGLALRDGDGIHLTASPPLPDLSRLPRPDRRGAPVACLGHAIAPLIGSRGCYANCSFCCIAAWHERSLPGRRYRVREVEEVAAELVAMKEERGVEVFVFHDDNFFLPGHSKNLARFHALADALEERGIGRFATVVKARPTDVDPEVFRVLVERLHCIRCYIGIETDADQGLQTLQRWAQSRHNHRAIEIARELDLFVCFNLLLFDPDTTLEDLDRNVSFLAEAAEFPHNFGRVELYAGTPLLARMQAEGRTRGDWLQWDYDLASPEVDRVFRMTMTAFGERNFGPESLHNHLMGTRFDLETARFFNPDSFQPEWHAEGKALTRRLSLDSVAGMRAILDRVRGAAPSFQDQPFAIELATGLRSIEGEIREAGRRLARTLRDRYGGETLTVLGDRVATPLQSDRRADGARSLVAGEAFFPNLEAS